MNQRQRIILSLLTVYIIWGSTYLVIRFAIEGIPPLLMAGSRFIVAGGGLLLWLWLRGKPLPTGRQWRNAALIGVLMLAGGNGGVTFAEQWVATGLAAVMIATVPLWAALWLGLFERWPSAIEWVGLTIGIVGVILLNFESNLRANPLGAIILMLSPMLWALGSVLSRRLQLPKGQVAFAAEMIAGGVALLLLSLLTGERLPATIPVVSAAAWIYLVVFGSLIAFSAYMYLLQTVRPMLATSYAYVNPLIAVLLGVVIRDEVITRYGYAAMLLIICSVLLLSVAPQLLSRWQNGRALSPSN